MILLGDCLERLKEIEGESVQCCITSPPYWGLRDYGVDGQLGLEKTPEEFVSKMVEVFSEVRRVLKSDGTLWLNLGDSYAANAKNRTEAQASAKSGLSGSTKTQSQILKQQSKNVAGLKSKDLCGIPWAVATALRSSGWYLRQDIIWHKPNPMPESVRDRCTKAHEYIFLLSKSPKYLYNIDAIREECKSASGSGNKERKQRPNQETLKRGNQAGSIPWQPASWKGPSFDTGKTAIHQQGRTQKRSFHDHTDDLIVGQRIKEKSDHPLGKNKRSVWTITPKPFKGAHFATFPPALVEPCLLAGSNVGDTVLDPFFGAGTVGMVAMRFQRNWIGIELNPEYCAIAEKRIAHAKGESA